MWRSFIATTIASRPAWNLAHEGFQEHAGVRQREILPERIDDVRVTHGTVFLPATSAIAWLRTPPSKQQPQLFYRFYSRNASGSVISSSCLRLAGNHHLCRLQPLLFSVSCGPLRASKSYSGCPWAGYLLRTVPDSKSKANRNGGSSTPENPITSRSNSTTAAPATVVLKEITLGFGTSAPAMYPSATRGHVRLRNDSMRMRSGFMSPQQARQGRSGPTITPALLPVLCDRLH